ncbi:MAG: peptidyl-prolyl cis-trans isomerase [Anaerolineae bacterium]|nr:peptidyl-prolyl cis-trans isomerase [Anaerolineae bacterium]
MRRHIKRRNAVWGVVGIGLLVFGLAACSSSDNSGVVHIDVGGTKTQAAAQTLTSAAPPPSPTPPAGTAESAESADDAASDTAPASTPYAIPTDSPDLPPGDTVVTRVGNEDITLDALRQRVRFERWRYLYRIARLAEKYGTDQILDLSIPENAFVASTFETLADSYSFGGQVHRLMVLDAIVFQEALRRDIEVDPLQFNAQLAQYLDLTVGDGGSLPPEFEDVYAAYLEQMEIYSGMNEEQFRRLIRARTLYAQLQFLISNEPEAVPASSMGRVGVQVQDIVMSTEAQAQDVAARLARGEVLRDIAMSYGLSPTGEGTWRIFRWSDSNLTADVIEAVGYASPGDIVGPISIPQGWYVALVGEEVFDILSPTDVDALREQHFLNWIEGLMDDPAYMEDFENWERHIPQEPLPRDVSPLLVEENFVFPPTATPTLAPAPTATATATASE